MPGPDAPIIRCEDVDVDEVLSGILAWVSIETPSRRPDQIAKLLDHAETDLADLPISRRRIPGRDGLGGHLVLTYDPASQGGPHALAMGHVDTVWDVGTLAARPIRTEDGKVYGPGIYDMKAGSYLAYWAIRELARRRITPPRPVTVLLNSDEEIGSPTSRSLIEEMGDAAAFVLVPEPAIGDGVAAVTSRKGWGRFTLKVQGLAAHAGANHEDGRSAIREIARQILELEAMTDYAAGTTVNVGVVAGGTLLNVVPADACIEIDLRVRDPSSAEDAVAAILGRKPHDPDVTLTVEGGINRPPFRRDAGVVRLYEAAAELAEKLGFALPEAARGGVSDGNFTAARGHPTLDGLGCGGAGAHAVSEHITLASIAPRAALMAGMMGSGRFQKHALGETK